MQSYSKNIIKFTCKFYLERTPRGGHGGGLPPSGASRRLSLAPPDRGVPTGSHGLRHIPLVSVPMGTLPYLWGLAPRPMAPPAGGGNTLARGSLMVNIYLFPGNPPQMAPQILGDH